jgi:chaperone required for assembly of F1-ATPase
MLATKTKNLPVKLSLQEWHTLVIDTKADEVTVQLDGKAVGSFKGEGVAHETKTLISLTTNQVDVEYDDFSIKGAAKP